MQNLGFNILGIVDFNILDKANVGFNFLGKEDFWQNLICVVLGGVPVKKSPCTKTNTNQVENKAWKPGVARPSKSKARWVNTTNKMQVFFSIVLLYVQFFQISHCLAICSLSNCYPDVTDALYSERCKIITVSGFHCSWSEHPETASKQPRCSQVRQFTPTSFLTLYFRFSDKGTKETENSAQK